MEKVIQFNQNDEFYFKMGRDYLQEGNIVKSIKYLNKAIEKVKGRNDFLLSSYYLILAQAYAIANNLELSNYYYFACLDSDIFAQIAFRGLGENFARQNDDIMARFYLNQCVNLLENSQLAASAKQKLQQLAPIKNNKGFRIVGQDDKIYNEKKIAQAAEFMSKGKFEKAIELLEKYGDFNDNKVRAELSLAYFFVNDTQKGIDLIKNYGNDNILDLCNLLLIYYCEGDKENFAKIKDKLRKHEVKKDEDNFKIGLTFAQTGELDLAKLYMEKFLSKVKYEMELEFLYSLACINSNDFETAKNKLLDLKTLDPFNNYIYNYYLGLCEKKEECKLEYIFNVPVKEFMEVQNKIKMYLVKKDEDLKIEFLANKDLFYFIASVPDSNTKSLLLLKLAGIEGKEINEYFKYILLQNNAKIKLKERIVLTRLNLDSVNSISLIRENLYTKILLPNKKATKVISEKLNKASINCVEFLLTKTGTMKVNLKRNIIMIERKDLPETVDENVLSAYLTWSVVSQTKQATLNDVCLYFSITQADFYSFTETYGFEV